MQNKEKQIKKIPKLRCEA